MIHGDGLAETTALLQAHAIGAASLVHVDPFDFRAAEPTATSALQLVTRLAAAGIPAFAWYGLTSRSAPHELFHEVTAAAPTARAWSAELRTGGQRANAAGIGSGCGVLFTPASTSQLTTHSAMPILLSPVRMPAGAPVSRLIMTSSN